MSNLIPFIPDFFTILLALALCIFVYVKLPSDMKSKANAFLLNYGIYIAIILITLYLGRTGPYVFEVPDKFPANVKRAYFFGGLGLLLFFAFRLWLYEQRYNTNQAIADNRSGSCHRYNLIGNIGTDNCWLILFIGGSGSSEGKLVFPWPFAQEVWVVPYSACQFIGGQILIKSQINLMDDYWDVAEEVSDFVKKDYGATFARDKIYFGLWDIELTATNPKYNDLKMAMEKKDARINELKEMLKGRLSIMKTFASDTMAMSEKLKGKSFRSSQPQQQPQPQD